MACLALLHAAKGLSASYGAGDIDVTRLGYSLIDAEALTIDGSFGQAINGLSFQQEAVVSHAGWQYVGYYDKDRHVALARRALPNGSWEVIRFLDYNFTSDDAHNVISIGICPGDGTIHLAFDHHVHPLKYRVSSNGVATNPGSVVWDASLFGPITNELEPGLAVPQVTYPRFWQTPDGALQFCYRRAGSGNGDRMLVDYDPGSGTWKNTRQIDSRSGTFTDVYGSSSSRCSYPNGYTYGPQSKLHTTWVWRESSQGSNHDLMYMVSSDQGTNWQNSAGGAITGPARVDTPGIVVTNISRGYGLMNTHGQAVDSQGRIHTVMWHCTDESLAAAGSFPGETTWGPSEARRYHHYYRDLSGVWKQRELPGVAGSRPKILFDEHDNIYMIYRGGNQFLRQGPLVIQAATSASQWKDWTEIHAEPGPFLNEMLYDPSRWQQERVLSILIQALPTTTREPTPLWILDLEFTAPTGDIAWTGRGVSNVTIDSAWAFATVHTNLDQAILVWDVADQGSNNTGDWDYVRSLGPVSAGVVVTGEMTNLLADTAYTWRFFGSNASTSGWSRAFLCSTSLSAAQSPVFTSAAGLSSTSIQLNWHDNASNETGYVLQRSDVGAGGPYSVIATPWPGMNAFTDDGLSAVTTYYYRLAATNATNGSRTDFAACTTNAATTAGSLIHHWKFDGDALDSVGTHHGSLNGDAGFAVGKRAQAVTLDGAGDYVWIGTDPMPSTDFTLCAWFYPQSTPGLMYIAGTQESNDKGMFLRVETDRAIKVTMLPAQDTIESASSAPGAVQALQWMHAAATVSASGGLKLYHNGSLVGSSAGGTSQRSKSNLTIGARPDNNATYQFDGLIDDVRVYDYPMSEAELTALVASSRRGTMVVIR